MKSVLISIQPKWVEKIIKGEKTIEVRKTRPKLETPFKCYIYHTKKKHLLAIFRKGDYIFSDDHKAGKFDENIFVKCDYYWSGKVIGEFVCDKVFNIPFTKPFLYYGKKMFHSNNCCKEACLSYLELEDYLGNKDGYGWHISDLLIYEKPKELSEFCSTKWDMPCGHKKRGFNMDFCMAYENGSHFCKELNCDKKRLTRPPQSWCYVESLGE